VEPIKAPRVLERAEHGISSDLIAPHALKVLQRLHNSGHKGYLVGGSVRDLLLGREPKDFDVATDARPNEIRRLFRNARIIGRRFRLAHVLFREGVIETSTFRGTPDPRQQKGGPEDLLITSDNTFGTPREDAFRRDFTLNALFYDIGDHSILDYVGGLDDLEKGLIRVIGEPAVRFQEDPVRMLRACEFAGRLDFTIEPGTQEGIYDQRRELLKGAPPRLTEELLGLLRSGHMASSAQWMAELGMLDVLLPEISAMITAGSRGIGDFDAILPTLDQMAQSGREIPEVGLLGALLLPQIMVRRFESETASGCWMTPNEFSVVVRQSLDAFGQRFALANFKRTRLAQALDGFHKLCEQRWTQEQRVRFASKSFFDDTLLLFEILVRATHEGLATLEQWQAVVARRKKRPRDPDERRPKPRRRHRRRSKH
jgi:poly(A) polymerase